MTELEKQMARMFVPEEMLDNFEIVSIEPKDKEFIIRLDEQTNTISDTHTSRSTRYSNKSQKGCNQCNKKKSDCPT